MYNYTLTPTMESQKHKVFVSFHHDDEPYRDQFDQMFGEHFISVSVDQGDIDPDNKDEYIKRVIQQDNIIQSSVVFALYGAGTHKRKHVDWELSAALHSKVGGHKGLVVLLLPGFPVAPFNMYNQYDPSIIYPYLHPRTAANVANGYADLYFWPGMFPNIPGLNSVPIPDIIEVAFNKRQTHNHLIDNSHPQYQNNLP